MDANFDYRLEFKNLGLQWFKVGPSCVNDRLTRLVAQITAAMDIFHPMTWHAVGTYRTEMVEGAVLALKDLVLKQLARQRKPRQGEDYGLLRKIWQQNKLGRLVYTHWERDRVDGGKTFGFMEREKRIAPEEDIYWGLSKNG